MTKIDYVDLGKIWPKAELTKQLLKSNLKKQIPLYILTVVFISLVVIYSVSFNLLGLIVSSICLGIYVVTLIILLCNKVRVGLNASKQIEINRYLLVTDLYIDLILRNKQKENVIRVLYSNLKIEVKDDIVVLKFNKNKLKVAKKVFKKETLDYLLAQGDK